MNYNITGFLAFCTNYTRYAKQTTHVTQPVVVDEVNGMKCRPLLNMDIVYSFISGALSSRRISSSKHNKVSKIDILA